jgi:hypothetical protein
LNRHSSFKEEAHYEKDENSYFSNERTRKYKMIEPALE